MEEHKEELLSSKHEFNLLSAAHGWHPLTDRPTPLPSHTSQSLRLWYGAWASAIIGSLLFALLNIISLEGGTAVIFAGSLLFAVLLGCIAGSTVSRLVKVDVFEPRSAVRADRTLTAGGILALASFAVFCFLRFSQSESARTMLPWCAMAFEVGCLVFSTAATELRILYSWPENLAARHEKHTREIGLLQPRISARIYQLSKEKHDDDDQKNDSPSDPVRPPAGPTRIKPDISARKLNGAASNYPSSDRPSDNQERAAETDSCDL
jgi:hypothetical protein